MGNAVSITDALIVVHAIAFTAAVSHSAIYLYNERRLSRDPERGQEGSRSTSLSVDLLLIFKQAAAVGSCCCRRQLLTANLLAVGHRSTYKQTNERMDGDRE